MTKDAMTNKPRYEHASALQGLTLGKSSQYLATYAPELLQPVPRSLNRDDLGLDTELPFHGVDIWNLYELSWLNSKGKPVVAVGQASVPATSDNLIESKSFKLYLNSLNQSRFGSLEEVQTTLERDLGQCARGEVKVTLSPLDQAEESIGRFPGACIDDLDIDIEHYQFDPELLRGATSDEQVEESLHSHLLKSNCLVTNQPDWGSVFIHYQGKRLQREPLLRYLVSFRQHNEFHEQCVERIFMDLMHHCQPDKLTVYARYTRRGGLDINPFRSNWETGCSNIRLIRQ